MSSPVDGQPRHLELRVPAQVTARRLDACLVELEPELSRAAAQRLIGAGLCLLNGCPTKPAASVRPGDTITLTIPPPAPTEMVADALPLDIAYEDADVVVVNKARGMVVHPAAGNPRGTLANALLAHCTDLAGVGGELRPGIVHRLDKDTSGLLVAAKNDAAHRSLSSQIKARTARRSYWALCWGIPEPPTGEVEAPLGRHPVDRKRFTVREDGRPARTSYRVLERFQVGSKQTAALLGCTLHTGRTHQIRVHLSHLGHPLLGDPVYGRDRRLSREAPAGVVAALEALSGQALHARGLSFRHPRTGEELAFEAEPPEDFRVLLEALRAGSP